MKKIILWLLSALCALFMGVVALPNAIPLQTASADNTSASTADDLGTLWSSIMVSDNLTSSIQGQWYKINIPYQGELTIDFSHDTMASSSTYWNIYLYQSNASTNWADASGSSWNIYGDANRTIENIYLTAGTYYIKIDNGSKYSSSTYEMTLSFTQNAYCESECNSSHEQADPIQLNASYAATIINSNDVDWFTFTTYYAGYITIDFLHESLGSTSKYWNLYLYQADAATRFNGESASWSFTGNETNSATSKIGLPAGTYYIKITDSSKQSAIPYNLCVNFTKTNYFEKENNGDFTLATPMQVNQTYTGVISFSSDVDWYQFTTTQTGHFNVSFTHDSNGSTSRYWKILLLGSDGATYITDITHQWNIIGSSNMHTAEYGIPADTYYIKVTDNTYNTDIPYNITVNFTPSDDWEQENNHTYSTANDMQTKKTWNGAITSGSDKDWFKIQTTYTANYTVKLTHTAIDVSDVWWIYVYQNDGATTIKSLKVKSNSTANSLTLENLSSGTYYVRVSGDSNSDASYTVSITDDHTHSYSSSGTNYSSSQHYKTCSLCKEKALFSHTWNSGTVLKSPTHLETGVRKYTCTECQATKESSIPQTAAHEYGDWEQFSATQHVHTCICGEKEYVDHNWNSGLVTTPPTCTENGVKEYVCQSCSLEKTETLAPEHKPVTVPAKKPTCTEDGYNAYSYCGVCNEEIVEMVAVPATGHTASDWKTETAATCTANGVKYNECTVCFEKLEVGVIPQTGHSYNSNVVAPTCEKNGYTQHTCAACGDSYQDDEQTALGHTDGDWIIETEATCTENGVKYKECTVCHEEIARESIAMTGHQYQSSIVAPTCEEQGYTEYNCVCGDQYRDHYVNATGHVFGEWEDGGKYDKNTTKLIKTCVQCGATREKLLDDEKPNIVVPIIASVGGTGAAGVGIFFLVKYIRKKKFKI